MVIGEKRKREPLHVSKVPLSVRNIWSNMMLVLPNVTMEPSNVIKK